MAIFVLRSGGSKQPQKRAYVIYEWYLKVAHVVRKVGASGLVWVNVIEAFIDYYRAHYMFSRKYESTKFFTILS